QRVVTAFDQVGARQALAEIEAALDAGLWAAGFFSYELGYGFEERLKHRLSGTSAVPLGYMGLFDAPARLTAHEVDAMLAAAADGQAADVAPLQDFADYEKAFDAAKALIAAGDIYQVNLTLKAQFALEGDALGLYRRLAESQKVAYGAYIDTG